MGLGKVGCHPTACLLSCPQSRWNRRASGMYCVCVQGGGPQPTVPWDTASWTQPLDSGTTNVSRCGRKIFFYKVCLRIYVLVTSCFSFLLCCSLKDLKVKKKEKKETNTYFWLHSETFF